MTDFVKTISSAFDAERKAQMNEYQTWNSYVSAPFDAAQQTQYAIWRLIVTKIIDPEVKFLRNIVDKVPTAPINETTTFIKDDNGQLWYFDAVIKIDHTSARRITEHPIQIGANVSDHSYQLPARVTLEIGMSDVMGNVNLTPWGNPWSTPTKSVMAYQQLRTWQSEGLPLTLSTRLWFYGDMVIENIHAPDDFKTKFGMRCSVAFKQIITAEVIMENDSYRVDASGEKDLGNKPILSETGQLGVDIAKRLKLLK